MADGRWQAKEYLVKVFVEVKMKNEDEKCTGAAVLLLRLPQSRLPQVGWAHRAKPGRYDSPIAHCCRTFLIHSTQYCIYTITLYTLYY